MWHRILKRWHRFVALIGIEVKYDHALSDEVRFLRSRSEDSLHILIAGLLIISVIMHCLM